jgi:hypothetical protein
LKRAIICTTINKPTEAIKAFSKLEGWDLIIVGDLKTPHEYYETINCMYLSPKDQSASYSLLSEAIGWNCVQRRNIGFIYAYQSGYEIIATVDDDNIPHENWGKDILVGQQVEVNYYITENSVFDPLAPHTTSTVWHRGYPIQLLPFRDNFKLQGKSKVKVMIQSNLVNGDPDVDAISRITMRPYLNLSKEIEYYTSNAIMPFNSQNTIIHRDLLPFYFMFPFVGRMDDIWGSYILQLFYPNSVVFGPPTVTQIRNDHDLVVDLENEITGYKNTISLVNDLGNFQRYLPKQSINAYLIYKSYFNSAK